MYFFFFFYNKLIDHHLLFTDRSQYDLSNIPKIFLSPNLDLSKKENFEDVFAFSKDGLLNEGNKMVLNVKQMQEKVFVMKFSE